MNDNMMEIYNRLSQSGRNCEEICTGERARAIALECGIEKEKWNNDRVEMGLMQDVVTDELSKDFPDPRRLVSNLISNRLQQESNDVARKGVLLQALQLVEKVDEAQLAEMSDLNVNELQRNLENCVWELAEKVVLPQMQQHTQKQTLHSSPIADMDAGLLAVSAYMAVPQLQVVPGACGMAAGVMGCCAGVTDAQAQTELLGIGLLIIAATIVFCMLNYAAFAVVAVTVAELLVEGTAAGLGVALTAELHFLAECFVVPLVVAFGSAVSGALALALSTIQNNHTAQPQCNTYRQSTVIEAEWERVRTHEERV